jgi:hypothetical protein
VALCHVKVGNRQALYPKNPGLNPLGFFLPGQNKKGAQGQGSRPKGFESERREKRTVEYKLKIEHVFVS